MHFVLFTKSVLLNCSVWCIIMLIFPNQSIKGVSPLDALYMNICVMHNTACIGHHTYCASIQHKGDAPQVFTGPKFLNFLDINIVLLPHFNHSLQYSMYVFMWIIIKKIWTINTSDLFGSLPLMSHYIGINCWEMHEIIQVTKHTNKVLMKLLHASFIWMNEWIPDLVYSSN